MEGIAKQRGLGENADERMQSESLWLLDAWTRPVVKPKSEPVSSSWRAKGTASLLHAAKIIVLAAAVLFALCLAQRSNIQAAFFVESRYRSMSLDSELASLQGPLEALPGAANDSGGATISPTGTVIDGKRSKLEEELLAARKAVQCATPADSDSNLHPSVYHNVGTFSKSYELMTKTLRVYAYQERGRYGQVDHVGPMTGPNCVEGRFLKIMSRRDLTGIPFITQDPEEAHVFFLPYSTEKLRIRYRNTSAGYNENLRTLLDLVNDYVEEVATNHPFWNRTEGRDHFILACTDMGPRVVGGREDSKANVVKAVCNADWGGDFVIGKDVAVPVLRLGAVGPYADRLGGPPPSERSIFAFFAGGRHGRVREALLKTWEGRDPDMKVFSKGSMALRRGNHSYVDYMRRSKYCICAAGWHPYSPRTTESIYYDCVPVIIADYVVPPFSGDLDWTKFSVRVAESDIPNLKAILKAIPEDRYVALQGMLSKVRHHFVWNDPPVKYDAFHMILHGVWTSQLNRLGNDILNR